MEKIHKGQVAKILVVLLLLLVISFASASTRTSFLYLLLNFLIVVLAIDSGIIGTFPDGGDDKIKYVITATATVSPSSPPPSYAPPSASTPTTTPPPSESKATKMEPVAGKVGAVVQTLKRRPSMPSLFFIGDGDEDGDYINKGDSETEDDEPVNDPIDPSAQELFLRAEAFIGNFYRQLKIQREESWRRIHGLCRRPL